MQASAPAAELQKGSPSDVAAAHAEAVRATVVCELPPDDENAMFEVADDMLVRSRQPPHALTTGRRQMLPHYSAERTVLHREHPTLSSSALADQRDSRAATRHDMPSADLLEPTASAVRGFRALIEAALRAPGALGGITLLNSLALRLLCPLTCGICCILPVVWCH